MSITILLFGAAGGILSSLVVNYFTKNLDYKYDYKKYVLNKRQLGYDEVEKILSMLEREGRDDYLNIVPAIFTVECFSKISTQIRNTLDSHKVWLSNKILSKLNSIDAITNEISSELMSIGEWDQAFTDRVTTTFQRRLLADKNGLYEIFFDDISNLDNIRKFKKSKIK